MRRVPAAPVLLLALAVAACGGSVPTGSTGGPGGPSSSGTAGSESPAASSAAVQSAKPSATGHPGASAAAPGSASPGDGGSQAPPDGASPGDSAGPAPSASDAALACSPGGTNPDFWPGIAGSVSWDVYCAVLPKEWTVSGGKYRLANGGYLAMSYKGPSGATLTLSEGSFCTDGSGCVPSGGVVGNAQFGALPGTLVATDSGGFAIVVARGEQPSWLMVTSGLDQATTLALGAALARIGG